MRPEEVRIALKKQWLEQFYEFIMTKCNQETQLFMDDLLKFEADCMTIQVIYNSIGNKELNAPAMRGERRRKLCPALGYLYPQCEDSLSKASTLDALREAVKHIEEYNTLLRDVPDP